MAPRRSAPRELVFVNNRNAGQEKVQTVKSGSESVTSEEPVDMEIIILGPGKDKQRDKYEATGSADGEAADSSEVSTSKSIQATSQPAQEQATSPLNETLLKRLEKQYVQKRIVQADDNTYVDYLDYF